MRYDWRIVIHISIAVGLADREPLVAFAELSKIMLGDQSLNETLERIAALACKTHPDIDEASVTMVEGDKVTTVDFRGRLAVNR